MAANQYLSELLTDTQNYLREEIGVPVLFGGKEYIVTSEECAGVKAGEQGVPRVGLGPNIAATSPRVFLFSPHDFMPYTNVYAPVNGDIITFNGWDYYVTHPDVEDMARDTTLVIIYGLRNIAPFI